MEPSERRQHERVSQGGRVVGRATVMTDFRVVSLTESGASLETSLPMALGSSCDLSLRLGDGTLDLRARVRGIEAVGDADSGPFQVAVAFESLDDADRAMLRFFVSGEGGRT